MWYLEDVHPLAPLVFWGTLFPWFGGSIPNRAPCYKTRCTTAIPPLRKVEFHQPTGYQLLKARPMPIARLDCTILGVGTCRYIFPVNVSQSGSQEWNLWARVASTPTDPPTLRPIRPNFSLVRAGEGKPEQANGGSEEELLRRGFRLSDQWIWSIGPDPPIWPRICVFLEQGCYLLSPSAGFCGLWGCLLGPSHMSAPDQSAWWVSQRVFPSKREGAPIKWDVLLIS